MNMENKPVPNVTFKTRVRDESIGGDNPFRWQDVTTAEIFSGKRIVIVAVPGAFTPTCSLAHLPGFEEKYNDIISNNVDEVYCTSVNDAFVMYKWGQDLSVKNVKLLPDGNGEFAQGMGLLADLSAVGFGHRSLRYAMVVNDGVVEQIFIEEGPELKVSDADTMLSYLTK